MSRCLMVVDSKINGTPKSVYLPISKLHSILAEANLIALYNIGLYYFVIII